MRQNILVFFRFTFPIIVVHLQNANAVSRGRWKTLNVVRWKTLNVVRWKTLNVVRWKRLTLLYDEFTQENTHQILLGSAGFRLR